VQPVTTTPDRAPDRAADRADRPLLRVAVDATSLYDPLTGVGRFTAELLRGAGRRADLEVRAFAVTWRGRERLAELVPPGIATPVRWPMAAAPLRAAWGRADRPRIERWTGTVDVVHGPNFVVPPARAAQVVTVHDLTAWRWPELCTDDVRQHPALVARAVRRGAWIHTPSAFVRDEVIELVGAAPERVVAIANGITPPSAGEPADGVALVGCDRYVLVLGTIEPRKDHPSLVAAFDLLAAADPEVRLVVAGPDGWGAEAYQAAIAACGHRDRIVRLGYVDEAQRGALMAGASVMAVPSRYEGFGLTAAEAMLAGVPVVATTGGSLPEVVGDAGLLVPVGDVEALAGALARALQDDDLAADLAARGRKRAAGLTWSAATDAIADLWHRAATR
jgi:glycosyltransferase involved in cell wall biosynthesis